MPAFNNRTYAFAMLAIFALGIALRWSSLIHHDVAWSLYLTTQYLNGATLYVDLIEVNPPLIYWLMAPGVLFGQATGLAPAEAMKVLLFGLAAGSRGYVRLC